MKRDQAIPQTAGQAYEWGWRWIVVRCLTCRHHHLFPLADMRVGQPLGQFADRVVCRRCLPARMLEFELGTYDDASGQPFPVRRPIAFEGYRVVAEARE